MQHYVIKVVSDLRQVSCFLRIFSVSPTNKTDLHDITEILLKVALGIIKWLRVVLASHGVHRL
jgi:hypothetical protein